MRRYGQYQAAATRKASGERQQRQWLMALGRIMAGVGLIVGIVVIVGAGVLLYRWMDAPILAVAIATPLQRVSQVELESIVSASINGGFLSLDLLALCRALEAHPWVAEATVRRYWPDRLEISLREEVAIARWGQQAFVNQGGQLSQLGNNGDLVSLPYLSGPDGSVEDVMREYRDISELLLSQGLKVREFGMDNHRRWRMRLDSGFSVRLGRHYVLAKVRRFLQVWDKELESRKGDILVVDARYENGVAVSWR